MKDALDKAIKADVRFRGGLPIDMWNNFGFSYSQFINGNDRRRQITNHIESLFRTIGNHLSVDDAIDKMSMKFLHNALPPVRHDI